MEQLRKDDRSLFEKIIDFFKNLFTASKGTQFEQDVKAIYDRINGLLENVSEYDKNATDTRYSLEKPRKNYYNEFNTLAMQWANNPTTEQGDIKRLFSGKNNKWCLVIADENSDGGFRILNIGNYEEVKEFERLYESANDSLYRNTEEFESAKRRSGSYSLFDENRGNAHRSIQQTQRGQLQPEPERNNGNLLSGNRETYAKTRYSIGNIKYIELAQSPKKNNTELREMVQNAAKEWGAIEENGKPKVFYHGTDADFTVFDSAKGRSTMDIQGMFFSPWEIDAQGYGKNVGEYYLNIQNPAPERVAYKALNMFTGQNYAGIKARDYLISLGYDGVNNSDEEYIAFFPEQIKSADPVTYDDSGNVIPLSERFNQTNPDIRYSKGELDIPKAVADGDMTVEEGNQQIQAGKQQFKKKQAAKEESKRTSVANEKPTIRHFCYNNRWQNTSVLPTVIILRRKPYNI